MDLLKSGSSPEGSHVVRDIKYSGLRESHRASEQLQDGKELQLR